MGTETPLAAAGELTMPRKLKLSLPPLIAGPYAPPRCRVGDHVLCQYRGDPVEVAGMTESPFPWPGAIYRNGHLTPILTGALVDAVRTESCQAVAAWWNVSRKQAQRWRRALGVGRFNEGTRAVWVLLAPRRLSVAARRKGAAAANRRRTSS